MPGAFLLDRVLATILENDPLLAQAEWIEIRDVQFHRFIKLNRPQTLRLRRSADGRVHVLGDVVHASGRVLQSNVLFAEVVIRACAPETAKLAAPRNGKTMTDRYVEAGSPVALSGAFDCLRNIVLGSVVRSASCESHADSDAIGKRFSALAVDAAWRLFAMSPSKSASHVPHGLGRLSIHRASAKALPHQILTAAPRVSADTIACDRFEVTGCRFSRAWDRWFLTSFPPFATG